MSITQRARLMFHAIACRILSAAINGLMGSQRWRWLLWILLRWHNRLAPPDNEGVWIDTSPTGQRDGRRLSEDEWRKLALDLVGPEALAKAEQQVRERGPLLSPEELATWARALAIEEYLDIERMKRKRQQ